MALAALSPWPSTPAALTAARACLRSALHGDDLDDARVDALGEVAAALVEHYAPGAPDAVKREAVIRCAGWIVDSPTANLRAEVTGPFEAQYAASQTGAMLHSGAKGLLYPWRVKTAGIAV